MKNVITVSNKKVAADKCVAQGSRFYEIGKINIENSGDCYHIDGRMCFVDKGEAVFEITTNQYVNPLTTLVVKGVLKVNNDLSYEEVWFKPSIFNVTIEHPDGKKLTGISESSISKNPEFVEDMSSVSFTHISLKKVSSLSKLSTPPRSYKDSLDYGANGRNEEMTEIIKNIEFSKTSEFNAFTKLIEGRTFGVEFETVKGVIPERLLPSTGLIPLRDGSIAGIEYSTGILSGEKGIQMLINACDELSTRTDYDNSCALHFHIGGIPRTKEFILAAHLVTLKIQKELFSYHPVYKEDNMRIKSKNYCKGYDLNYFLSTYDRSINAKNIDRNFDVLFQYLSQGRSLNNYGNKLSNVKSHPADESGRQKWHIRTRYHVINFIPLLFTNFSTLEFRIHLPDSNKHSVIANLLINMAIVKYAEMHTDTILSACPATLTLDDIISSVCNSHTREYLISHMQSMRATKEDYARRNLIMFQAKDVRTNKYFNLASKVAKFPTGYIPVLNLPRFRASETLIMPGSSLRNTSTRFVNADELLRALGTEETVPVERLASFATNETFNPTLSYRISIPNTNSPSGSDEGIVNASASISALTTINAIYRSSRLLTRDQEFSRLIVEKFINLHRSLR